eukprot:6004519-Amphidinium_carterae.1
MLIPLSQAEPGRSLRQQSLSLKRKDTVFSVLKSRALRARSVKLAWHMKHMLVMRFDTESPVAMIGCLYGCFQFLSCEVFPSLWRGCLLSSQAVILVCSPFSMMNRVMALSASVLIPLYGTTVAWPNLVVDSHMVGT